ncbi:MAG TPA: response regulator [Urbifossiella sp.]|jgi:CheY-like chemotaxis protein|nr:response regulator [Urbifossiella sp.]
MDAPRGPTVLVVDGHPDTAESTADLCRLLGSPARYALAGEDALRLAADDPPDVILLEIRLPDLDGCELARRLALAPGKPPLLIAVTTAAADRDRARTAAAGFHLHLVKPVHPGILAGLLRRWGRACRGSYLVGSCCGSGTDGGYGQKVARVCQENTFSARAVPAGG